MTGMDDAIKKAARTLWDCDNDHKPCEWRDSTWNGMSGSELSDEYIEYLYRARTLADAGLLAPAPLREEQGFEDSEGKVWGWDESFGGEDRPVHRYVTDWSPVDKEES